MVNLNPATLAEESREETLARQRQTGVLGNGHIVQCHPTGEPDVVELKSRVTCLVRPYPSCQTCPHSRFTLSINADPNFRFQQVMCPKWEKGIPTNGDLPVEYIKAEIATCADKPFPFCPSCPSLEALSKMYIDKKKDGWYSRYRRFQEQDE